MRWPPLCARAAPKAPGVGSQGPQQGALCWFKGAHRLPGLGLRRAVWPGAGRCTSLCQSRSFASQDRSTAPYRAKTRGRLVNAGPVSRRGRRHQPCPPPPLEDAQPEAARTQPRPREPAEGSAPSAAQTARLAPTPFPDLSLSGGAAVSRTLRCYLASFPKRRETQAWPEGGVCALEPRISRGCRDAGHFPCVGPLSAPPRCPAAQPQGPAPGVAPSPAPRGLLSPPFVCPCPGCL